MTSPVNQTASKLRVSRVLHAGYLFECDGHRVLFDPIFETPFSRNCHSFPRVTFDLEHVRTLRIDAIFISHYHDDHCSFASLDLLDRGTPIYLYCVHEALIALIRELGFERVHSLNLNESVCIGAIEVIPRRALDADVDSIFHVRAGGVNVLNVVDSWIDADTMDTLAQAAPWDLILWPFQTMREIEVIAPSRHPNAFPDLPVEWIQQLTRLDPKVLVPSSCQFSFEDWSWYNRAFFPISYAHFTAEMQSALPQTRVRRLDPGRAIEWSPSGWMEAPSLEWIHCADCGLVDYQFDPSVTPPPTAEIARQFDTLTWAEAARVTRYLEHDILNRYPDLDPSEVRYFSDAKVWRLVIYDGAGVGREFRYLVDGDRLRPAHPRDGPAAWCTEIAAAKLFGALEHGEALTSLYLRINDVVFDSTVEENLREVDILEDPLVRCLYTGRFAGYQIAQLRRLQSNR